MDNLIKLLKVAFSPITIIVKFIQEDDTGILAFLCFILWFLAAGFSWIFIASSASFVFQLITFMVGYLLTYIHYHKIDGLGKGSDLSTFLFFLIMAVIAGYTFGLFGHFFFLLY